jgi:heme exporter protein CcmD
LPALSSDHAVPLGDRFRSARIWFKGKDVSEFFAMGNYGPYVWTAYGVTIIGLLLLFIWSWFGARARESELEQVRQWARAERRSPTASRAEPAASRTGAADDVAPDAAVHGGGAHAAAAGGQASE